VRVDPLSEADAQDLVIRVRMGDQDAWVALTDRYTNRLWSIARAMRLGEADAADAVQTTWLRLVESLDKLRDSARVGSWLATTMRRECLVALRRSGRIRLTASYWWDDVADPGDAPDAMLLREERDAALWKAFGALKPWCQSLLRVLMADPPPSYAEVSAALDMPVGSIGPTRQRCLDHLRNIMLSGSDPAGTRRPAAREDGRHG
jgi:RNA polymerase sigma factor (sigma-70 family)